MPFGKISGAVLHDVTPRYEKKLPLPAVKQDWVAAVRGLTDRKRGNPAHPKMPHAQPP
ncbi:hypothetical protein METHPM2_710029 [Pseudomonas sp. PM2]